MLTEVYNELELRFASIAMSVPVFINACAVQHGCSTVQGEETKHLRVHCRHSYVGISEMQQTQADDFDKRVSLNVLLQTDFYIAVLTVIHNII